MGSRLDTITFHKFSGFGTATVSHLAGKDIRVGMLSRVVRGDVQVA